jgi:hypothetical protein
MPWFLAKGHRVDKEHFLAPFKKWKEVEAEGAPVDHLDLRRKVISFFDDVYNMDPDSLIG